MKNPTNPTNKQARSQNIVSSGTMSQIDGTMNIGKQNSRNVPSGIEQLQSDMMKQNRLHSQFSDLFLSAIQEFHQRKLGLAIEKFDKCIEKKYRVCQALKMRSQAYFLKREYSSAQKSYQQLIDKFPNQAAGYYGKAFSLATRGQTKGTGELYQKAEQLDQKNYKIYFTKGYSTLKTRNYEKSLQLFQNAFVKNDRFQDPMTFIALAEIYCHRRNFQSSRTNISYATRAIKQTTTRQHLYKFQVEDIQQGLQKYNEIVGKLKQAQSDKKIDKTFREESQFALTRALNKSLVLNTKQVFTNQLNTIQSKLNKLDTNTLSTKTSTQQIIYQNSETTCNCRENCSIF